MTELTSISNLKQSLSNSIESENFDLLSPEVLYISQELDQQMLPIFKQQLDYHNAYLHLKKPI
ncbi:hypothetical protein AN643_04785 [Candidatus Epulonipiscioides saccharophilum]|nr:hypothetical protein AN643_04785 [Epulopiscium sp. SCG-B10WGA-EpuloB]